MAIIRYQRNKCDECGKEVDSKEYNQPYGWLEITICRWKGSMGEHVFRKEVCSKKCALKMLKKLKRIPKFKPPIVHI